MKSVRSLRGMIPRGKRRLPSSFSKRVKPIKTEYVAALDKENKRLQKELDDLYNTINEQVAEMVESQVKGTLEAVQLDADLPPAL